MCENINIFQYAGDRSQQCSVNIVLGYGLNDQGFESLQGQEIFFFS